MGKGGFSETCGLPDLRRARHMGSKRPSALTEHTRQTRLRRCFKLAQAGGRLEPSSADFCTEYNQKTFTSPAHRV